MEDKLKQLISKWRAIADKADDDRDCYTSKWYSSMTEQERKVFNHYRDEAYNHRRFANQLEELLNGR